MAAACLGLIPMSAGTASAAKSNFSGTYSGTTRLVFETCGNLEGEVHGSAEVQVNSNWGKGTIYTDQCTSIDSGIYVVSSTFQFVTPKGTLYAVGATGPVVPPGPPCDVGDPAAECSAETNLTWTTLAGTGSFKKVVPGGTITLSGFSQGVQGTWPFNYTAVENGTLSGNL